MAKDREKSPFPPQRKLLRKYNYRRGANFERRCKAELDKYGYLVCRSAGSHGEFDLIALDDDCADVLLVQCKTDGKLSLDDKKALLALADKYNCVPVLASMVGRQTTWFTIEDDYSLCLIKLEDV